MATVINELNRHRFAVPLREMHADRKTVFVDQLKWQLPVVDDAYEIDDYDRDDTIYLVVQDAATGGHLGSVRLLPTAGPHLLGDKFAFLCDGGVAPSGDDIFEITRMVTRPGLTRDVAQRVREQLSVAIVEFALQSGISRYTMMTHMAFLSAVLAVGWDCEPLGLPATVDGDQIGALLLTITPATLILLRDKWNFAGPVLRPDDKESALVA